VDTRRMKTYWQAAWAKHPSMRDTEITILGSIVLEWDCDGVPEWEFFQRTLFPVTRDEIVQLLEPQFILTGISDILRNQQPRLSCDTYQAWVIEP